MGGKIDRPPPSYAREGRAASVPTASYPRYTPWPCLSLPKQKDNRDVPAGYTLPMNIQRIITRGLKTGFVLAATTTAVIMLASDKENGSSWSAVNAVAHVVDGDDVVQPTEFSPRESVLGILVNGTAMCAWGVLYEGALELTGAKSNLLTAIAGTAASYLIDYKVVPKQYTPGIENRLSGQSVGAAYAALGITLALSGLWNKDTVGR